MRKTGNSLPCVVWQHCPVLLQNTWNLLLPSGLQAGVLNICAPLLSAWLFYKTVLRIEKTKLPFHLLPLIKSLCGHWQLSVSSFPASPRDARGGGRWAGSARTAAGGGQPVL